MALAATLVLAACSKEEKLPATPSTPPAAAAVVAAPAPQVAPAAAPTPVPAPAPAPAPAMVATPAPAMVALPAPAPAVAAAKAPTPQAAPAPTPAALPAAPQARSFEPAPNTGKVIQVQQAGAYTYAEVEARQGVKAWIAGTHLEIKPGDMVQWGDYSVMRNFNAKSIGRVFDEVLFVNSWGPAGAASFATPAHGSLPALPTPAQLAEADNSGKVKSVANAGGYSYIEIDRGGKSIWVAGPETAMKAGDTVQWQGATQMSNFNAKSLGRTFERIIFASSLSVAR